MIGHSQGKKWKPGPSGPPKKSVTKIADQVIVFMNSARKKSANRIEEYSVWKPPPSSDSPSARSNGGRLSSAVEAMKKITPGTIPRRIMFQSQKFCAWEVTIARVESECDSRMT